MSKAGFFTPTELAFGLTIGKNEAVQPFDFTGLGQLHEQEEKQEQEQELVSPDDGVELASGQWP